MNDEEDGRNEDMVVAVNTMRDRVVDLLGAEYGKRIDSIVFDLERLGDSKPALLVDFEITFEKLERLAPRGRFVRFIWSQILTIEPDINWQPGK